MKPISRVNTATDENKENRGHDRNTTSESSENTSMLGSDHTSSIGNFTDRAQEMASTALNKAQEYGETALEETGSFVRRYPAQTLLAGLGIGLFVGWAWSRR